MRPTLPAFALLALLSTEPIAAADRAPAEPLDHEGTIAITSADNNQRSGVPSSALALQASSDASEVSLTLSPKGNGQLMTGGQLIWSVVAKAPLDKETGSGSFVTEQGLSNKFAAELGATRIFAPSLGEDLGQAAEQAFTNYRKECQRKAEQDPTYLGLQGDANAPLEAKQDKFRLSYCDLGSGINVLSDAQLRRHISEADLGAIREAQARRNGRSIWIVNAAASIGYGRFKFFDPVTFTEAKDNKTSFALSASFGVNPAKGAPFFGAGYEYKREYGAPDKRIACRLPVPAGGPNDCRLDVFDKPEKDVSHNIFGLVRVADLLPALRTSARFRLPIAVEVRTAYDFQDKIFGAAIPIYFLLDEKGSFRGGTKFSWADGTKDSNKDEFKFSIFVVKSFDLFGL